jgi:hypothetical protein
MLVIHVEKTKEYNEREREDMCGSWCLKQENKNVDSQKEALNSN